MGLLKVAGTLIAAGAAVAAQGGAASIVSFGYSQPAGARIAPGQILTIFVSGINPNPSTGGSAATLPLPVSLAGISVTMSQPYAQGQISLPAPILSVVPYFDACMIDVPDCTLIGVTIQVPVRINPNPVGNGGIPGPGPGVTLTVSDGTNTSTPMFLNPVSDQIHILGNDPVSNSPPAITHLDGSLVSASNPASVGEVLVLYGVGRGVPFVNQVTGVSGQASPSSPPISLCCLHMVYDYRPNASPSKAGTNLSPSVQEDPTIVFDGFTPGLVGVFQVNFVVPAPPGPIPSCVNVLSNLTVTVVGGFSFDGGGICVTPPSQ